MQRSKGGGFEGWDSLGLDHIGDPAFVLDARGALLWANRSGIEATGRTLDSLAGQRVEDILTPESREQLASVLAAAPPTQSSAALVLLTIARPDGSSLWIETRVSRIEGQAGWLLLGRDISGRGQVRPGRARVYWTIRYQAVLLELAKIPFDTLEAALPRISEGAAHTLEVNRVSIWFFNGAHTAIVCQDLYDQDNNAHEHGAQLSVERYPGYFRALGESRIIAAHDAWSDPRTAEFAQDYLGELGIASMLDAPILQQGRAIGVVCHERTGPKKPWRLDEQSFAASIADLVALACESSARRYAEEKLREAHDALEERVRERTAALQQANASLRREIAERGRTEAALRESEQRLATLVEYAPDAILIVDAETGHFVHVNENAMRLFGLSRAALLTMGPADLSPERQADGRLSRVVSREKVEEAANGGSPTFEWLPLANP